MKLSLGIGIGLNPTRRTAQIITRVSSPTFGPYVAGDTPEDEYTPGTYASSAGDIDTVVPAWTVNGEAAGGDTVLSEGDVVSLVSETVTDDEANERVFAYTATSTVPEEPATVPAAFTEGMWSIDAEGDVTISSLPDDGGSDITDVEYRVNEGSPVSFGETTTGTYSTTAEEGDDVQIRTVNAEGEADWSDTKVVPSASPWAEFDEEASGEAITWGDVSDGGEDYRVAILSASDNVAFSRGGHVEYAIVAGGGGGGTSDTFGGGGGGGGQVLKFVTGESGNTDSEPLTVVAGVYAAVVGAKGLKATSAANATKGGDATFGGLTAEGGGIGGRAPSNAGVAGGAGGNGGGGTPGSTINAGGIGEQFNGGNGRNGTTQDLGAGGGGGAAEAGGNGTNSVAGKGGDGLLTSISGTATRYGAGGGGGGGTSGNEGAGGAGGGGNGTRSTGEDATGPGGGGGGGRRYLSGAERTGGDGADGLIILRVML